MDALVKWKWIHSGHCTHVMKLMEKGVTATTEKVMKDTKILLTTLVRKQNVLEKCDGDILDQIDEVDEIGKEIEESSEFVDSVIEAITRLEAYVDYMNRKVLEYFKHLHKLQLARPPWVKNEMDILIGLDYYFSLMTGVTGNPIALESCLGWIICGRMNFPTSDADIEHTNLITTDLDESEFHLKTELKRFW